ncbi:MAG: inorganic phosphate transporter [candidate division Zixibacteria bacterium]|nr:inorganic phosphate transporter [candidate division Zixibacteria bacterium]
MIFLFLSSGLFLGWSLGANDGANVFGTAVGSKMLRFKTAAIICGIFVIIGAFISGSGTSHTINKLGSIDAIAGSFIVALAAAIAVFWMSKLKLPVSTSQAIVGSIIGWNFFAGLTTNINSLLSITSAWVISPILAGIFAIVIYRIIKIILAKANIHLLRLDLYTRLGLILVCASGAYSLGANNIANVMGVFVSVSPFQDINVFDLFTLSSMQQLFIFGGLAIAVGVFTYSHKVIETVGSNIFKLSPEAALAVVLSNTLVLFMFSSVKLQQWLISYGLPSLPLVPISSSQAVVGAVIGIGIIKGARSIRYKVLGEIAFGWVITPIIAGIISFIALFIIQNVFNQKVSGSSEIYKSNQIIEQRETFRSTMNNKPSNPDRSGEFHLTRRS